MIRSLLIPVLGCLLAAGCARVEPPPGGPEDRLPPQVVETVPDTASIVPGLRDAVVFRFSERISETGVEDAVIVSPRTSPVSIDRGRSEIRVSLREGWQPDVIYQITLRSEIRDLFNNALASPYRLIFSTGPAIPETRLSGRVTDRITGAAEANLRVEAIRTADSLVYAVATDTAGRFELDRIPPGSYRVRAFDDVNRNRVLNDYEARDTVDVEIAVDAPAEAILAILEPDSTGAVIRSIAERDGFLVVEFDDYLDPAQTFSSEQVGVFAPNGDEGVVAAVSIGESPAATDSVPSDPPAQPSQALTVEMSEDTPLLPGEGYRLIITDVRNIHGLTADVDEPFDIEAPPDPPPAEPDSVGPGQAGR